MDGREYGRVLVGDEERGEGRPPDIRLAFRAASRTDAVIVLDVARAEKLVRDLRDTLDSFYRRPTW